MKLELGLIFIACIFVKCNSQSQTKRNDLEVPDSVINSNIGQTQVTGSHIFMKTPQGFSFNSATNRLEVNDSKYIKVVESPTASYADKHNTFIQVIKQENAEGFKTYYQKEFILQNQKAIILYGLDKLLTTEQIILLFGNETGSTMLLSRFPANDTGSKNEILKSLLSSYKVDSSKSDISSIRNFTIDMLNTSFKYNSNSLQMFFYTVNGLGDPTGYSTEDLIIVGQMPPIHDENLVKEKTQSMIENYKKVGFVVTDFKEDKIPVDNHNVCAMTITGKLKEKKVVIYGLTIGFNNIAILFQGIAYDNYDIYLQQFKQIAQTIRPK